MATLNAKQQQFVAEYLIDLNATQAAIRAGYSEKTAQVQSSRLLSNAMVAHLIAEGASKRIKKAEITAQDVLEGLHLEATRTGDGASHSARVQAWGLLGKYHKLFTDRFEGDFSGEITVTDAKSKIQHIVAGLIASAASSGGTSETE